MTMHNSAGTEQAIATAAVDGRLDELPARSSTKLGIVLALCSIPSVMSAVVLVPILPELLRAFGAIGNPAFWIPALITLPGLFTALFSPVAGYLGDKIGLKIPIIASLTMFALCGAAPIFLNNFSLIMVTRVALGIAQAGALVLSVALIGQQFDGVEREKWLALQTLAATSSSLILLPLSGFLAQTMLGWHGSFLIFLSGLVLAGMITRIPLLKSEGSVLVERVVTAFPWRWMLAQCGLSLLIGVLFFSVQLQLGLALSTVGITGPGAIGLLSAGVVSGTMLGSAFFVQTKQALGKWLLPSELLLSGMTLVLMTQFPTVVPLVVLAFLNMIACGLMLPTLVTSVAAGLSEAVRGRGLGLWNSSFMMAQFLSAAVVGYVLTQPGANIFDAFVILGNGALIMAVAGFLLALRLRS